MLGSARAPRDLPVADVAHQRMPERVLVLAVDRRGRPGAHELLLAQLLQTVVHLRLVHPRHGRDRPDPEDLADHRGVVQQRLLDRRQRVEPGRDQRMDRLRDRDVLCERRGPVTERDVRVEQHPHELLGVQRVASRLRDDGRPRGRRQLGPLQQRREQRAGVLLCQRRQGDRHRVPLAAAPAGTPVEQLGAGRADDQQRHRPGPLDQVLDELEHRVVGPLQVLEQKHEGPVRRQALEESPPGGEELVLVVGGRGLAPRQPDERRQAAPDPVHLRPVQRQRVERAAQLPRGLLRRVRVRGCPRARGRSPTAPRTSSPRRRAGTGPGAT